MNNIFRHLTSGLRVFSESGFVAILAVTLLALPVASIAQDTTSSIQGTVSDAEGNVVAGANLRIVHGATGRSQTTRTNASGYYRVPNLRVGGPYSVTLEGSTAYGEERIEDIYVSLSNPYVLNLTTRETAIDEIIVSSSQQDFSFRIGAGSTFGRENIDAQANVNRDFKNVIRQDPRVSIDPTNSNAVSIAGTNNRFNSLTVDGVRQNDDFGLNNSGFPTQRSPISIDSIEQIVVDIAPFDVSYGGFTGGTINAVTKSGTNDWDGSLAFYRKDQNLVGDTSKDNTVDLGTFKEDTTVVTLSGPIIKDKLWFFASWDNFTATDTDALLFGPEGSGRANEITGVTQFDVDEVIRISNDVYGFNAGTLPSSGTDVEDEKIMIKLDWAIADGHDATLTYQDTSGTNLQNRGSSPGSNRLGLPSNWYTKSEALKTTSLQVFSVWSDRFSTELKIADKEIITGQDSLFGTDFAQMNIDTAGGGTIRVGPDIFRHANSLRNDEFQIKLKGEYIWNNHTFSAGYERDALEVFNLFVFQSEGEYDFDSIADFEARTASELQYRNAFSNDENDGAAAFKFEVNSFYVQDVAEFTDKLTVQYGIRYDWYTGTDRPDENPGFEARNGFKNTANLDGRDVFMPRVGFTYDFDNGLLLRGGVGLFSGGNPNVWVSNSFSNDGQTIVNPDNGGNFDPTCAGVLDSAATLTNVDAFNIAQGVQNCMFPGAGDVEATDPNFDIPSTWRYNLAVEREFDLGFLGDGWMLTAEGVWSRVDQAAEWFDLARTRVGPAPADGRPIYNTPSNYDVILTNTSGGSSDTYSLSASKLWDTRAGVFDMFIAYTYMDAEDVNPSQSSTVSSNYGRPATFDRNGRTIATSDFQIKNRINGTLNWSKDLFGNNMTQVSMFFEWRTGKPFSYTMREANGDTSVWGGDRTFARRDSQLLYVPLLNDPNVIFSDDSAALVTDTAVEADFNAFVAGAGLEGFRGQILPRNFDESEDRTRFDLRIVQEIGLTSLPLVGESRLMLYFDIENLGNLLNDDWGRVEQVFFPHNAVAVDRVSINANGQYVYGNFGSFTDQIDPESFFELPSLWQIQLGLKFEF